MKPYQKTDEIQPPLGLGYLATTIRDRHDVKIMDGIKLKMTIEQFREEIINGNYDVIGIQCYTWDKPLVKKMIAIIREVNPKIIIVIGGPHPSSDPESIYSYFGADFGIKGEAEIGFSLLMDFIANKKIPLNSIPGLIWAEGNKIVVNAQRFVENLDDLKHPSWDLLGVDSYPVAPHGAFFKRKPTAPIFATRGCPYQCTFCAGIMVSGRKIRFRSVKNFVDEIEMLHKDYGINEIHIEDDNFSIRREFVVDFCNELIKRNIDITWTCPNGVRLDTLDKELLDLMKKSGLYSVSVGIESGSDRILKDMKKSLTKADIQEKVGLISKAGLDVIGFFILGYPGETIEDINDTIDFACSLPLKRASFMTFKPFPGTSATEKIKGELNVDGLDWEKFALNTVAYSPKNISSEQLKKLRHKALMRFYLRPKIVYDFLRDIKSIEQSVYISKRAFRWLVK